MILGAGHRDVEQTAFFLDFLCGSGGEIGGDAAIDTVEHKDGFSLLTLGRMNSRAGLGNPRRATARRLIVSRIRRIECELSQKLLRLGWLEAICASCTRSLGASLHRRKCARDVARTMCRQLQFVRPADGLTVQQTNCFDKLRPVVSGRWRRDEARDDLDGIGFSNVVEKPGGVFRSHAWQKLNGAETRDAISGILCPA